MTTRLWRRDVGVAGFTVRYQGWHGARRRGGIKAALDTGPIAVQAGGVET